MHSELPRGSALITLVFLQHRQDEAFFELAYGFGVKNIAFVHLHDECFELISHGLSLSLEKRLILLFAMYSFFIRFAAAPQRLIHVHLLLAH
jgi:hypothetical protein